MTAIKLNIVAFIRREQREINRNEFFLCFIPPLVVVACVGPTVAPGDDQDEND